MSDPSPEEWIAPEDRAELLYHIDRGWRELTASYAGLDLSALAAPGADGGWSIAMHLGHVMAWERDTVAVLSHRPRHTAMQVDEATFSSGDDDAINAQVAAWLAPMPPAALLAALHETHAALLSALRNLGDAELSQSYRAFAGEDPDDEPDAPVLTRLIGHTYGHYREHAGSILAMRSPPPPRYRPGCRATATRDYTATYADPISFKAGESVQVGRQDDEWPTFLWCISQSGKSGWTPLPYLDRRGSQAVARRDYSAIELTVAAGEGLTLEEELGGWYWAATDDGRRGWVPAEVVNIR